MKNLDKTLVALMLILILASLLRVVNLGSNPEGLNVDEVFYGYEAYSILKTGYDHRMTDFLPLYLKGYSDKTDNRTTILYIYSLIPIIKIFGLNEFSIRSLAALIGVLTVLLIYFLTKEIFRNKTIGLIAAFLLAISPWHIALSRFAHEPIFVPFLTTLGMLLFIKGMRGNKKLLIISAIPFALSFYSYAIAKALTPIFLVGLCAVYRKKLWSLKKEFFLTIFLFLAVSLPAIYIQINHWGAIQGEFQNIRIFNYGIFWPLYFIINYIFYFSLPFFFNIKLFWLFDIFFIIFGFIFLFKHRNILEHKFLIFWFLIFPLAASLTILNTTSAINIRGTPAMPITIIIESIGVYYVCQFLIHSRRHQKTITASKLLLSILVVLITINLILLERTKTRGILFLGYLPGFKNLSEYIKNNQDNYEKIIITNKPTAWQQHYMYLLFYLKYDPKKFHNEKVDRIYLKDSMQAVISFDKYKICDINECYDSKENNLYVVFSEELPSINPKKVIYNQKGETIFKIVAR